MKKKSLVKIPVMMTLLFLFLSLTGCSREKKDAVQTDFDDRKEYLSMSNRTESDDGIYYIQHEREWDVLKYIDKKTAKETALCRKLNCKHNSKECPAVCVKGEFMSSLAYSNGKLYYMVQDLNAEPDALNLYCMNPNGTEKKLLHQFENQSTIPNGAGLYKGKIFLSMPTMKQFEDGTGEFSAEPSLIMYDLKSDKETVLIDGAENEGKFIVPCGGSGDGIYFGELNFYETQGCVFKRYDFAENEITTILEASETDLQHIRDDIIYIRPETGGALQGYEIKTKESKDVLQWEDDGAKSYVQDGYIEFVKESAEDGKEQFFYRWYDMENGKYLFDDYQNGEDLRVVKRLQDGYWMQKSGAGYLYDPDGGEWRKIKEVR